MIKTMQRRLDREQARHQKALEDLANERVQQFVKWWKRLDGRPLKILFGMGSEFVTIEEKRINFPDEESDLIRELFNDLQDITDGYEDACPDSIEI